MLCQQISQGLDAYLARDNLLLHGHCRGGTRRLPKGHAWRHRSTARMGFIGHRDRLPGDEQLVDIFREQTAVVSYDRNPARIAHEFCFFGFGCAELGIINWVLNMLPSQGCAVLGWTAIDLGAFVQFFDMTMISLVLSTMLGFEVAIAGFRVALWLWKRLYP